MEVKPIGNIASPDGSIHLKSEVYSPEGGLGSIEATAYKDPPKIIVEGSRFEEYKLSPEGVRYVLAPQRGEFCRINPEIACTITTKMNNWVGNFISPDVVTVERSDTTLGNQKPVKIIESSGRHMMYDGKTFYEEKEMKDGDGVTLFESADFTGGNSRVMDQISPTLRASKVAIGVVEDPRIIDVYNHRDITDNGISGTITTKTTLGACGVYAVVETNRCIQAGTLEGGTYANMHEQSKRVYDTDGAAPTMHTCGGGNLEPKILEPQAMHLVRSEECKAKRRETKDQGMSFKEGKRAEPRTDGMLNALTTVEKDNYIAEPIQIKSATKCGYEEAYPGDGVDLAYADSSTRRGKKRSGQAQTLTTSDVQGTVTPDYRIRKLTERECMRLMGVKDEDSDRVHKNQSKSSMYHLAGDSIVTGVLMGIFGEMCGVDYKSKINDLVDDLTKEKRNESHS